MPDDRHESPWSPSAPERCSSDRATAPEAITVVVCNVGADRKLTISHVSSDLESATGMPTTAPAGARVRNALPWFDRSVEYLVLELHHARYTGGTLAECAEGWIAVPGPHEAFAMLLSEGWLALTLRTAASDRGARDGAKAQFHLQRHRRAVARTLTGDLASPAVVLDHDNRIVAGNRMFAELVRRSDVELHDRPWLEVLTPPPSGLELTARLLAAARAGLLGAFDLDVAGDSNRPLVSLSTRARRLDLDRDGWLLLLVICDPRLLIGSLGRSHARISFATGRLQGAD
jgi:hypothetical protein